MQCIEGRDLELEESKKTSQGVCQVWAGDTGGWPRAEEDMF